MTKETRGRPRDSVYDDIAKDVMASVKRRPTKKAHEWVVDILRENDPLPLDSRYQGFRQSTTYKELKAELGDKGYKVSLLLVSGFDVTIRVTKV